MSLTGPRSASRDVLPLMLCAAVGGALTGLVAASFAVLLDGGGELRMRLIDAAHGHAALGFIAVVAAVAATTAVAAWLVHRVEPHAEGSGIPRVEAVVAGRMPPGRIRILPVKYVGGLLSMSGGLALGREGPSVQMGAVVSTIVARWARLSEGQTRLIIAGGAAAGLATAFNAPIAGGVFVLEELLRRFDPRGALATLAASGSGFAAIELVLGNNQIFQMAELPRPTLTDAPLIALVGVVTALLAVAYNRAVLLGLRWADTSRIPVVARAAAIGAAVGALAWVAPSWVGGGDNLTQAALDGSGALAVVVTLIATRFVLGVISYAALTPGGLFAPMLALGAQTGLLVGLACAWVIDVPQGTLMALALVGMAAFFTASVQAPVTGLVLATEMTGSVTWLPPMLGAVAIAMVVAMALRSAPLYDALAERSARNAQLNAGGTGEEGAARL